MPRRRALVLRAAVWMGGALLLAALIAPWVRADRFRGKIETALEEALDRKVDITGPVRFQLWPGPGFSAEEVIIHDDPAVGIEPLAYVGSLSIAIRPGSLWRRRLEVATLRLREPSVNLLKTGAGQWNFPSLLERAFATTARRRAAVPDIQVRSGRLNFKFGETKSVFYFTEADLDIDPDSRARAVRIRFAGRMARTDRPLGGAGRLSGRGRLLLAPDQEGRLELNLHLERSALAEILVLLQGRSLGLGGFLVSTAQLEGPLSALMIRGSLQLAGVGGGLLAFGSDRWSVDYTGRLNLNAQDLLLESRPASGKTVPVWFRLRATGYLTRPRWAAGLAVRRLPIDSMPALARELGASPPPGLALGGLASGAVSWSAERGPQGQFLIEEGAIAWEDSAAAPVRFPVARFLLLGDRLRLEPTELRLSDTEVAFTEFSAGPSRERLELRLRAEAISIARFLDLWGRLTAHSPPPLLAACAGGRFDGSLHFSRTSAAEGVWDGALLVRDALLEVEGLARPVELAAGGILLDRSASSLRLLSARAGRTAFSGEYRFSGKGPRPHFLRLSAERIDAGQLEELLSPALRRRRGLLARTFRFAPPPVPVWLRNRRLAGRLEIARFESAGVILEGVRTAFYWDGPHVELAGFQARYRGAPLEARLVAELGGAGPIFRGRITAAGLGWNGGELNLDAQFRAEGAPRLFAANLRLEGSFSGKSLSLGGRSWERASGCFELVIERGAPRERLPCVELHHDGEAYYGYTMGAETGSPELLLFQNSKELTLAGPLLFGKLRGEGGRAEQQSR